MKYAHSLEKHPPEQWQPLSQHLHNVAKRAADNAAHFQSADWAYLAGLLHDFGKASDAFQAYLLRSNGLDDSEYDSAGQPSTHSGAGAVWAMETYGQLGNILAYLVMGHHAGLPDWIGGVNPAGSLCARREEASRERVAVREWASQLPLPTQVPPPPFRMKDREVHFWIRMLYSCLVDADYLDTERFLDPKRFAERRTFPTLDSLAKPFFAALDQMQQQAEATPVNQIRAGIRRDCEQAAQLPPGFFSLSVPTGGGKTLSGTAFAFRHALQYNKQRIIYVIPYTSIIEQTTDVLRKHLGADAVVEHHSNLESESQSKSAQLAAENWDAPVIVTTSVQFFESLLAARSKRCRKLHNIVNSVVVLDEVQLLPPEQVNTCSELMRQLVERYGVTIVLSTATQPVLPGLAHVREIVSDPADLAFRLKRVEYEFPDVKLNKSRSWDELAEELKAHPQVLCVVNTRRDCRELHAKMPDGAIHLSTTMCGAHRSNVIAKIKRKLTANEPVQVISTQLIEAGVDIDFPVVYRALAGLDSIAQSAGRCNREGKQLDGGKVVVFIPPRPAPKGTLLKGEDSTRTLLHEMISMEEPGVFRRYFQDFYGRVEERYAYETYLVQDARDFQFQFREAAHAFQMIDQAQQSVFVRFEEGDQLIETLRKLVRANQPYGWLLRKLQRYSMTLRLSQMRALQDAGQIEEFASGFFVWNGCYDPTTGADIFNVDGIWSAENSVY